MEAALEELERVQTQILKRVSKLEAVIQLSQNDVVSPPPSIPQSNSISETEARLSYILRSNGFKDFLFKKVAADYYDWPLETRRDVLGAASIHHLCKSIVLVNTQAQSNVIDCSDRNNSKYYVVVVQYTARFNAETFKNFLYSLNDGKIPKKKFNLRLAPEEMSVNLTGYEHNAVTCIGMKTDIPTCTEWLLKLTSVIAINRSWHKNELQKFWILDLLNCNFLLSGILSSSFLSSCLRQHEHRGHWGLIAWADSICLPILLMVVLDEAIVKLNPDFFWLGGGEVDLKLGMKTSDFIKFVNPFIVSCS